MQNVLTQGPHLFTSPSKGLTFEYIVHHEATPNPSDLLVIHPPAWGLGSEYLQAGLRDLLTARRPLLFFHPRGTNNSSFPPDPGRMSSMPDLASDLEDLRLHLGLDAFPALLGHSNGGAIVLGYAEMYPSRVRKLVLLNHSLIGFTDRRVWDRSVQDDERYRDALRVLEESEPRTDEDFTSMVRGLWPLYFFDTSFVEQLVRDIGERIMPIRCWRSVYRCDKTLENPRQMLDRLERVQAKTLILFGKDDLICGPYVAERSKEGISNATLLGYDSCGHFPWIEKKERTLADIAAFLEGRARSNMCI